MQADFTQVCDMGPATGLRQFCGLCLLYELTLSITPFCSHKATVPRTQSTLGQIDPSKSWLNKPILSQVACSVTLCSQISASPEVLIPGRQALWLSADTSWLGQR